MRILITNDDGIFAEGIYRLAKQMQYNGEVVIVAPDGERSASGHAITMRSPLMVKRVKFFDTEIEAYSTNGTPADCVKMGIEALFKTKKPDIVISGINDEPNLGTDVIYSGTVAKINRIYKIIKKPLRYRGFCFLYRVDFFFFVV